MHCLYELRLACLEMASKNAMHPEDADEVLTLADMYLDFVREEVCEEHKE